MLKIVLIMSAGILVGYLLRNVALLRKLNHVIFLVIIFLLFLMGAGIGANEMIVGSLAAIGMQALTIAVFTTFGSLLAAWCLSKFIFKDYRK